MAPRSYLAFEHLAGANRHRRLRTARAPISASPPSASPDPDLATPHPPSLAATGAAPTHFAGEPPRSQVPPAAQSSVDAQLSRQRPDDALHRYAPHDVSAPPSAIDVVPSAEQVAPVFATHFPVVAPTAQVKPLAHSESVAHCFKHPAAASQRKPAQGSAARAGHVASGLQVAAR